MATTSKSAKASCAKCRKTFSDDSMVQIGASVYCEACADQVEATRNRRSIFIISGIGIAGVLAMVAGAWAYNYHITQWDREHRDEILSLKSQAELAQSQGNIKDAGKAYVDLLKIADGHIAQTTELSAAISQARSAFEPLEPDYRKILIKEAEERRLGEERAKKYAEEKRLAAEQERKKQEEQRLADEEAETIRLKAQWIRSQPNGYIWSGSDEKLATLYDNLARNTGADPVGRGVKKKE